MFETIETKVTHLVPKLKKSEVFKFETEYAVLEMLRQSLIYLDIINLYLYHQLLEYLKPVHVLAVWEIDFKNLKFLFSGFRFTFKRFKKSLESLFNF